MGFERRIELVVKAVETLGAAIMVLGGLWGSWRALCRGDGDTYQRVRRSVGRAILLGLEVLIIADIIRTIVVEPTTESVLALGGIVAIRIILSFALEVEMDGVWPWMRKRLDSRE